MPSDRVELAERLERAEGPSRELFEEAFAACYPKPADDCEPAWRPELPRQPIFHAWKTRQIEFQHFVNAGAWLDAAMTLLNLDDSWLEIKGPRRYLNIPTAVPNYWSSSLARWNHEGQVMGWGATSALALCCAAIRARTQSGEG